MSEQKWQRSSLRHLMEKMEQLGYWISHTTIARLLKDLGYSLKVNEKRLSGSDHPDRDRQFQYIASQKAIFQKADLPRISVDTKKKELIGNFKNEGQEWCLNARAVNDHDFEHDALGKAVPYGIYDLKYNRGYVYVGHSADTPQFAVEVIVRWWQEIGKSLYPNADKILILADSGGSNGCRPRLWKQQLQELLADQLGLEVTVCHYPTGASKWNPIEHRLFGPISMNWAGKPLETFEFMPFWLRKFTRKASKWPRKSWKPCESNGMRFALAGITPSNRAKHQLRLFKVRSYSFTSPWNCASHFGKYLGVVSTP